MKENGMISSDETEYHERIHSVTLGYNGMQKFLELPKKKQPTAIFMSNYEVALGVVMAINEAGISCPEDISLISFDELTLTLVMKPKMTVMVQPMESIASEAVRILLSRLHSKIPAAQQRVMLYATLSEGNSVRDLHKH